MSEYMIESSVNDILAAVKSIKSNQDSIRNSPKDNVVHNGLYRNGLSGAKEMLSSSIYQLKDSIKENGPKNLVSIIGVEKYSLLQGVIANNSLDINTVSAAVEKNKLEISEKNSTIFNPPESYTFPNVTNSLEDR